MEAGFVRCVSDACLYFNHDKGVLTIIGVYVDDLLATASSQVKVEEFFAAMSVLSIKDLGQVNNFLGMRVALKNVKTYTIDHTAAIDEMLSNHGLAEANGLRSPIREDTNDDVSPVYLSVKRGKKGGPDFHSLVDSLMWFARCSRPDTSTSRFTERRGARTSPVAATRCWRSVSLDT